jgi:metallo-beta-lactamase class B
VELGGTKLVAHLTPGHTEGATTWTTTVQENGHTYNVVIVSSASVVAEPLRNNKSYPGMVQDYERTFRILKSLACDIPLAPHGSQYGLDEKYKALQQHPAKNPFIDPEGYRAAIKDAEHAFQEKLAKESAH